MAIPAWLSIPFVGLLLSVALFPIFNARFWEKNQGYVCLFWSVLVFLMLIFNQGFHTAGEVVLDSIVNDYITFIVMLFGLYCVAGNISFEGDLAGSPGVNVFLLTMGTILSSMIGTTGASMLMVRPVIKMNSWRKRKNHIMIFFIFLVSNIGGCLTPIGDPPLLMGFMRGVPFTWSLSLWPILLFNMVILLSFFFWLDKKRYRMDIAEGRRPDISKAGTEIKIEGLHNVFFLIMIVVAVILSGSLPNMAAFKDAAGNVLGMALPFGVVLSYPSIIEMVIILAAAALSFKTTPRRIRVSNHFTWGAIKEVAILFIGIFITMQPTLMLLKEVGPKMGLTDPFHFFWVTGALSSFLDNTPTYLVFLTTAGSLGFKSGIHTLLGVVPVNLLRAISTGAVFMGANTYIGNAPNFMVKAISDENGIRMPSFFGYMKWSIVVLIPVFILDTLVFFIR